MDAAAGVDDSEKVGLHIFKGRMVDTKSVTGSGGIMYRQGQAGTRVDSQGYLELCRVGAKVFAAHGWYVSCRAAYGGGGADAAFSCRIIGAWSAPHGKKI
jgi:hypothetical protein